MEVVVAYVDASLASLHCVLFGGLRVFDGAPKLPAPGAILGSCPAVLCLVAAAEHVPKPDADARHVT